MIAFAFAIIAGGVGAYFGQPTEPAMIGFGIGLLLDLMCGI